MQIPLYLQFLAIFFLILCSAYFSSSETALMKLNPYRLRHLVSQGHRGARRANRLLRKQDRLLSVILIGNNLVNIGATVLATIVCVRLWGEYGPIIVTVVLTLIILIFAEVAPKTIAAERPERIAFPSSFILGPLQRLFRPVIFIVNSTSHLVVDPFVKRVKGDSNVLSIEELRTVVNQGSDLDLRSQAMMVGILDLGKAMVNDILIPHSEVDGIDIALPESDLIDNILNAKHTRLPVFKEELNHVIGIYNLKNSGTLLHDGKFDMQLFKRQLEPPYFVPSGTPLSAQLLNFQSTKKRTALVVDEYGIVIGIVTLDDILEEIVGEFTTDLSPSSGLDVHKKDENSFVVNGRTLLKELNSSMQWDLPIDGPRTLNGLVLETLEKIPEGNTSLKIHTPESCFVIETLLLRENHIRSMLVTQLPREKRLASLDDLDDDEDDDQE